jgi:hypothetical protein
MHGRMKRAVIGAAMVAVIAVGPALISTTSAGAWFTGNQGCTPGFWKNHPEAWADTKYAPTDTVGSVFTLPASLSSFSSETLIDALEGTGGDASTLEGAAVILLRAAVAGLLNATSSNVDYPGGNALIIKHVNAALATEDRDTILALAEKLDKKNNGQGGCPLS